MVAGKRGFFSSLEKFVCFIHAFCFSVLTDHNPSRAFSQARNLRRITLEYPFTRGWLFKNKWERPSLLGALPLLKEDGGLQDLSY